MHYFKCTVKAVGSEFKQYSLPKNPSHKMNFIIETHEYVKEANLRELINNALENEDRVKMKITWYVEGLKDQNGHFIIDKYHRSGKYGIDIDTNNKPRHGRNLYITWNTLPTIEDILDPLGITNEIVKNKKRR